MSDAEAPAAVATEPAPAAAPTEPSNNQTTESQPAATQAPPAPPQPDAVAPAEDTNPNSTPAAAEPQPVVETKPAEVQPVADAAATEPAPAETAAQPAPATAEPAAATEPAPQTEEAKPVEPAAERPQPATEAASEPAGSAAAAAAPAPEPQPAVAATPAAEPAPAPASEPAPAPAPAPAPVSGLSREEFIRQLGLTAEDMTDPSRTGRLTDPSTEEIAAYREQGQGPRLIEDDVWLRTADLTDPAVIKRELDAESAPNQFKATMLESFRTAHSGSSGNTSPARGDASGDGQHADYVKHTAADHQVFVDYKTQLLNQFRQRKDAGLQKSPPRASPRRHVEQSQQQQAAASPSK